MRLTEVVRSYDSDKDGVERWGIVTSNGAGDQHRVVLGSAHRVHELVVTESSLQDAIRRMQRWIDDALLRDSAVLPSV